MLFWPYVLTTTAKLMITLKTLSTLRVFDFKLLWEAFNLCAVTPIGNHYIRQNKASAFANPWSSVFNIIMFYHLLVFFFFNKILCILIWKRQLGNRSSFWLCNKCLIVYCAFTDRHSCFCCTCEKPQHTDKGWTIGTI